MDWIKDFMKPEFIWAMVGLILLLLEFALPGLIIFFFGVGAITTVAEKCLRRAHLFQASRYAGHE
ncbi:MAG: hypothetical protein ACYTBY_11000 [Planctomycetota bacterium]